MSNLKSLHLKKGVQHTLAQPVTFQGKGVHSNQPVEMTLSPASANEGIRFFRIDDNGLETEIRAVYDCVGATELCTIIGNPETVSVATIEHLMAALNALSVDNVRIDIDGAEVPVMDGSASEFLTALSEAGLIAQAARRRYIRIDKPIRVDNGTSFAELTPHDGRQFDVEIDFEDPTIGRQRFMCELNAETFAREIARARTFGFMRDVEKLWEAGYALGSSFNNSVVIGDNGVANPEGLRFADEFVRHKLLDAVGDLALSGAPIWGAYRSYKGGHKLNFMMLKELFNNRDAWSYVDFSVPASSGSKRMEIAVEPAIALAPSNY